MIVSSIALSGALFTLGVVALFAWGIVLGIFGPLADAPPSCEGGHAPGTPGGFDPHLRVCADPAA